MRKIILSILVSSAFVSTTFAATISCPSNASGCDQCFGFTLENTNSTYDVFIPRAGKNEFIDTSASTIFAETYQGANVTPTGNIKSSFTLNPGPSTSSWTWASMNGQLIQKGTIPSSINYSSPVYMVRYTTQSYTLNNNNLKESGSDVTHSECAYFYATQTQSTPTRRDGQCSNLDTYSTSNPRNSSLSGEDLCDSGTEGSVTYSASRERWTYTCFGTNGGDSDACIVDLEERDNNNNNDECRIEVTDKSGVVPFSTGVLCSGNPSGKTAIVVNQGGTIIDAIDSDSETIDFYDAGSFTISCYPDVVNNRSNVCKTTITVSGDCGNDVEESDEQCDDGNSLSGDGCNSMCQLEGDDGSVCGNGVKESREQCDDGNNEDGDTCTSICQSTTPKTGPLAALGIILFLSLGGVGYYFYRKRKNIA